MGQHDQDWLCSVSEHDDGIHIDYRFRYYNDDKTFDSEDTKNWYKAVVPKDETPSALEIAKDLTAKLSEMSGCPSYELIRGESTFEQFMEEFATLPFVDMKSMSKEEAEEQGYCATD
jgi:hypothetical protein